MSKIFVNYRSSDTAAMAEWLYEKLAAHFGKELVFRDAATIGAGIDYRAILKAHLALTEVMLVLIGRHWLDGRKIFEPDDFVRFEIATALSQKNTRVLPVLVNVKERLSPSDLPDDISDLAYRQYRHLHERRASHEIDQLILELEEMIGFTKLRPASPKDSQGGDRTFQGVNYQGAMSQGDYSPATVNNHTQPR